jgi:hypothetical protein
VCMYVCVYVYDYHEAKGGPARSLGNNGGVCMCVVYVCVCVCVWAMERL